jgi:hypothetical protein
MAYCERQDVLDVLEEASLSGAYSQRPEIIDAAITGLTQDIRAWTNRHWYDPSAASGDLRDDSPVTATEMIHDIPSSPHTQDRQLFQSHDGVRYPVTHAGPYCRIVLAHADVTTLSALRVRDSAGEFEDWTAALSKTRGRGEDYYLQTPTDAGPSGRTQLYLRAGVLPTLTDYEEALLLDYEYGTDSVPESVRRMTAQYAAAELVTNDEFVAAVPDDGQLVNGETKADRWTAAADKTLDNYRVPGT